ncbi:hypothetical protein [Leucobacter chinensis]|uniref:hypothetical protein n=1 Tax=Leucobacter chinensis TaxID=2851010 RepID=UPI001C23AD43|nr:hypothetical protein [Leucobacter chinensis]
MSWLNFITLLNDSKERGALPTSVVWGAAAVRGCVGRALVRWCAGARAVRAVRRPGARALAVRWGGSACSRVGLAPGLGHTLGYWRIGTRLCGQVCTPQIDLLDEKQGVHPSHTLLSVKQTRNQQTRAERRAEDASKVKKAGQEAQNVEPESAER